jgi:hypothetical protein
MIIRKSESDLTNAALAGSIIVLLIILVVALVYAW